MKNQRKKDKKKEPSMEATYDPIERERFVSRRTNWLWRLRPYIVKKSEQCKNCSHKDVCHRIPTSERIMNKILSGKKCPDFKSVWKKILSDEEKYDWGF